MPGVAYLIPSIFVGAAIGILWLARQYRHAARDVGTIWFARSLEACALWLVLAAAPFVLPPPTWPVLARLSIWPVVIAAAFSFFRFALFYSQQSKWWIRTRTPIVTAIVAELLLMLTNSYHHWMWRGFHWIEIGTARVPFLENGPAFYWLHVPLGYGLILAGVIALFVNALGASTFQVHRAAILSIVMLLPFAANVIVVGRITKGLDLTPIALVVSFVLLARTTSRYRLLDVMPAARRLLFDQHRDGVLMVDSRGRIIDANPAAVRLLGAHPSRGAPLLSLAPIQQHPDKFSDGIPTAGVEINHEHGVLEIRSLLVRDPDGEQIGQLVVLHDVSERARLIHELGAYARTVAHDLKNPLGAAIGYLDLARGTANELEPRNDQLLTEAEEICRRMVAIIGDLLKTGASPQR